MSTLALRTWRRLRAMRGELPLISLWAATIVGLELFGRGARSEAEDAIGVAIFVVLALFTAAHHSGHPLGLVARLVVLGHSAAGRLKPLRIELGLDLREQPPIPRRIPPILEFGVGLAIVLPILFVLGRDAFPIAFRGALRELSPTFHTLWLTLFWSFMAMGSLVLFFIPLVYLGEAMKRAPRWRLHRQGLQLWMGIGYALLLALASTYLPVWTPVAISLVIFAGFMILSHAPHGPSLTMLWKRAGSDDAPCSFHWTRLTSGLYVIYLGVAVSLLFFTHGGSSSDEVSRVTPVSHFLGMAFLWTFLGAYLIEVYHLGRILWQGRRADPAQPLTPRVFVDGTESLLIRRRVRKSLVAAGLDVVFPPVRRERTDVPIVISEHSPAADPFVPSVWPRSVGLSELDDPALHHALARRDQHIQRRAISKGLEKAFKAAKAGQFELGSGFWVAPHYWFVTHLSRDVDEDVSGLIGPPYRKIIPRRARAHMHVVMHALEIDLIFLEDGVRFRELKRVLSVLFEHYDVFGGKRLADERPFTGLPRLRVVIHDFVLDDPFRAKGYPEPDYEDLGRARILHVFRDRGGDKEESLTPADFDWMPAPPVPEYIT